MLPSLLKKRPKPKILGRVRRSSSRSNRRTCPGEPAEDKWGRRVKPEVEKKPKPTTCRTRGA